MHKCVCDGLNQLWKDQGQAALKDHMRFRALLRDYCPSVADLDLNMLVFSVQYGIAQEIIAYRERSLDIDTMRRLSVRMEKATGVQEEHVHRVIGLWANVLRVKLPDQVNANPKDSDAKATSHFSPTETRRDPNNFPPNPVSPKTGAITRVVAACIGILLLIGGAWYGYSMLFANGEIILADGTVYNGQTKWGKATGVGLLQYGDGKTYQGECIDGVPNGKGSMGFRDGSKYEGSFKSGNKEGVGKFYNTAGALVYEGGWANNIYSGSGTLVTATGEKYVGSFQNGQRHGSGVLYSGNGVLIYEGDWNNDKRHGTGKWRLADGGWYEGGLLFEQKDGYGRLYDGGSQLIYDGYWKDDKKNGFGTWTLPNGVKVKGNFVYDKVAGQFAVSLPNGEKFEGQILNDKFNGMGTYTWANGDRYTGGWKDNEMHGMGTLTLANGSSISGTWERGVYQEQRQAAWPAEATTNVSQQKTRDTEEWTPPRQATVQNTQPRTAVRTPNTPRKAPEHNETIAKKRGPTALDIIAALIILADKHKK